MAKNIKPIITLEEIIALIPGHVYWLDKNGIYLGCNDNQAKAAGLTSRHDIVGKRNKDLPWTKNAPLLTDRIDQTNLEILQTGISKILEEEATLLDGSKAFFLSSKTPLKDKKGEIIGLLGISIDITERKNLENALKKAKEGKEEAEDMNRLKTEFLSNMSHDVKIPLAGVINLADLLIKHSQESETLEAAKDIQACGKSLFGFFDNCLELSQLDNPDFTTISEFFNLNDLSNEVVALFKPAAKAENLALQIEYDTRIPEQLLGSRPTIFSIMQNLIGNAIKFTHQGSVTLKVALGEKSTAREAIVAITVQDTGIGISKEKQKTIFEHLTRLTPSYEGIHMDSGVGLYLVQKLAHALSGQVYVESEETKGSQFTVVLPLQIPLLSQEEYKQTIELPSPSKTNVKPISNTSRPPLKILLVEDNKIALKIAKTMLEDMQHHIDLAENGTDAIKFFESNKYDLIFADVGLPDFDGYKLTEQLRKIEQHANATPTPIIALTAHDATDISNKASASGIDNILSKPLSEEKVTTTIEHFIYSKISEMPIFIGKKQNFEELTNRFTRKAIDLDEGAKIIGKDRAAAQTMLGDLMRSLSETRAIIEKAFRTKNMLEFSDVIHQFYGGLCYVGTPCLRQATKDLENALLKKEDQQVNLLYQRFLDEMSAVEKEFEKDFF